MGDREMCLSFPDLARRLIAGMGTVTFLVAGAALSSETAPRPHIVYLLADDLGSADVGFHGGDIRTPHLDALAASGTRLEQFYVQSVCSPTRAALMTGRYPFRLGLQVGVVRPWAQYGLPLEERTLAQALREAGYETAIVGKWHLGHFAPEYLPTRRGFVHQYGHYNGAIDYFTHIRDGGFDWHRDDRVLHEEGYSTELIAREAVRILSEHDTERPLFLYVPFNAVHAPHQVPDKYRQPYAHLAEPRQTYASMVAAMDEAIGQIVGELERRDLRHRTLVVFHSDNGGPSPGVVTNNGPLRRQGYALRRRDTRARAGQLAGPNPGRRGGRASTACGGLVSHIVELGRRITRAIDSSRRSRYLVDHYSWSAVSAPGNRAEFNPCGGRDSYRKLEAPT